MWTEEWLQTISDHLASLLKCPPLLSAGKEGRKSCLVLHLSVPIAFLHDRRYRIRVLFVGLCEDTADNALCFQVILQSLYCSLSASPSGALGILGSRWLWGWHCHRAPVYFLSVFPSGEEAAAQVLVVESWVLDFLELMAKAAAHIIVWLGRDL